VATLADVAAWRVQAHAVHIDEKLKRYIVELVAITREGDRVSVTSAAGRTISCAELIDYGASPRATLALANLARARAFLAGRDFALPDDVRAVAPDALRHRIGFNYRMATEGVAVDRAIDALISAIPAP
jgi:MoxR-like ATPase